MSLSYSKRIVAEATAELDGAKRRVERRLEIIRLNQTLLAGERVEVAAAKEKLWTATRRLRELQNLTFARLLLIEGLTLNEIGRRVALSPSIVKERIFKHCRETNRAVYEQAFEQNRGDDRNVIKYLREHADVLVK